MGKCDVTYRMIPCYVTKGIHCLVKDGSSKWWAAFYFRNIRMGIRSVELYNNGVWYMLDRDPDNFFVYTNKPELKFPIKFRLTAIHNQYKTVALDGIKAGTEYTWEEQFNPPSSVNFDPATLKKITK